MHDAFVATKKVILTSSFFKLMRSRENLNFIFIVHALLPVQLLDCFFSFCKSVLTCCKLFQPILSYHQQDLPKFTLERVLNIKILQIFLLLQLCKWIIWFAFVFSFVLHYIIDETLSPMGRTIFQCGLQSQKHLAMVWTLVLFISIYINLEYSLI